MIVNSFCNTPVNIPDGHRSPVDKRLLGIEIEAERVRTDTPPDGWDMKEDGSLRNHGAEFITSPSNIERSLTLLNELYEMSAEERWRSTVRTSMHVHVDVRDLELKETLGVVAVYSALEPLLSQICGPDRDMGIYCVPFYRCNDDLTRLVKGVDRNFIREVANITKYAALNLRPMVTFGTMEFRLAPFWTTAKLARLWTELCLNIVDRGRVMHPQIILDQISEAPTAWVRGLFDGNDRLSTFINDQLSKCDFDELTEDKETYRQISILCGQGDVVFKTNKWIDPIIRGVEPYITPAELAPPREEGIPVPNELPPALPEEFRRMREEQAQRYIEQIRRLHDAQQQFRWTLRNT